MNRYITLEIKGENASDEILKIIKNNKLVEAHAQACYAVANPIFPHFVHILKGAYPKRPYEDLFNEALNIYAMMKVIPDDPVAEALRALNIAILDASARSLPQTEEDVP